MSIFKINSYSLVVYALYIVFYITEYMKFSKWTDKIVFRNDIVHEVIQAKINIIYHLHVTLKMTQMNLFTKY